MEFKWEEVTGFLIPTLLFIRGGPELVFRAAVESCWSKPTCVEAVDIRKKNSSMNNLCKSWFDFTRVSHPGDQICKPRGMFYDYSIVSFIYQIRIRLIFGFFVYNVLENQINYRPWDICTENSLYLIILWGHKDLIRTILLHRLVFCKTNSWLSEHTRHFCRLMIIHDICL